MSGLEDKAIEAAIEAVRTKSTRYDPLDEIVSTAIKAYEAAKGDGWCYDMDKAPPGRWIDVVDCHGTGAFQVCWNANGYWSSMDKNFILHRALCWRERPQPPKQES